MLTPRSQRRSCRPTHEARQSRGERQDLLALSQAVGEPSNRGPTRDADHHPGAADSRSPVLYPQSAVDRAAQRVARVTIVHEFSRPLAPGADSRRTAPDRKSCGAAARAQNRAQNRRSTSAVERVRVKPSLRSAATPESKASSGASTGSSGGGGRSCVSAIALANRNALAPSPTCVSSGARR